MTHFAYRAEASGDYIMRGLENSPSNWAEFREAYVNEGGEYQFKMTHFSGSKRDIQIAVNESKYKQPGLYSGAWDQVAITAVEIELHRGYNVICLYNSNRWASDIDKMKINKSH